MSESSKSLDERQVALVGRWFPAWEWGYNQVETVWSGYHGTHGWYVGIARSDGDGSPDWQSEYWPTREEAIVQGETNSFEIDPDSEEMVNGNG